MGFRDKAKEATDAAAQRAAALRDQAAGMASSVAGQTTSMASDLRDRAASLSSGLADAVMDRVKATLVDFNAALPVLRRAGYTVSEVSVEVGLPPKIVAVFARADVVPDDQIEQMLHDSGDAKLATMLVHALVRAHKLQEKIAIGGLRPKGIALEIGLTPAVVIKFGP